VPAKSPPIITTSAPAAMALAKSPEYFTPPSAITGMPRLRATRAQSEMAVICGTPTPATIARRADGARPDAHLDGVGAGVHQRLGGLRRRDVAREHGHVGVARA
jgi:hypothetical protein